MLAFDIHQHLWPEEVLVALSHRTEAPLAHWSEGCWTVELAGEPAFRIHPSDHDAERRAENVRSLGLDRAIVALSSAIGIESLPGGEATVILEAWREATSILPEGLQPWAAVPLRTSADVQLAFAELALDDGAAGVCIPAAALAGPKQLDKLSPLLSALEDRLVPLFVHPGPASVGTDAAPWWGPATSYVAELHAAWHAFAVWGRPAHPRLHVVYAALAGLAPLHTERTSGRGGPSIGIDPDPLVFYDTSSYGPRALRAMACNVGTAQLVHGSDHPVLEATPADRDDVALHTDNPARLLGLSWVAA